MTATPGPGTRVFALLGDPVSHSLSPRFQNAALRALGLDGVYVALRCTGNDLPGLLLGLARAGGGGNVTLPHKERAASAVEVASPAVRATGACNTFWLEDGRVHGDNTDVEGVRRAMRTLVGGSLGGARVLLAGAGGSARAALWAMREEGVERVVVVNRSRERAEELAGRFGDDGFRIDVVSPDAELETERFDLAVNATSLGLKADDPQPPTGGARFDAALDLVYAPDETPWVRSLRARGIRAADGKEMLLQQGAAAFRRWWGVEPPVDAMRAALVGGGGDAW